MTPLRPICPRKRWNIHHDKHHQAYVTNGNNAIKGTEFEGKSLEEIVKGSFGKNPAVFNNAGQHYNHLHFWNWMKPNGGGSKLPGRLEKKITEDLGGLDKFKTDFAAAGVGQFGSGWCWLSVKNGKLEISKTANGESPLVHGATPILGCDVWEHSYYIDYRNRRPDYLKAFCRSSRQLGICRRVVRQGLITVIPGDAKASNSVRNCPMRIRSGFVASRRPGMTSSKFEGAVAAAAALFIAPCFPILARIAHLRQKQHAGLIFADLENAAMSYLLVFVGGGLGATSAPSRQRHLRPLHRHRISLGHLPHQHLRL